MATYNQGPDLPLLAGADLSAAQYKAVKLDSTARQVVVCTTAGERAFGIVQGDAAAAGRDVPVRVYGTSKAVAGAAVSINALLTVDSSSRVVTAAADSDNLIGVAVSAASAANDIIEILILPQPAQGQIVAADGYIPMPFGSAIEIVSNDVAALTDTEATATVTSGGRLASDTTPALIRVNAATDKALRILWASSNSTELAFDSIAYPPDLDAASDVTVHLLALMAGATDTPTIDVQAWDGVGDTEMGGATGALTAALAEYTVTLAAANITGSPGFLNLQLVPGAHTTDALWLYAIWIEYTKK